MTLGTSFGPNKELALVFGFDAPIAGSDARLLIYSNSGQLDDVTLTQGDNQFLMEVESLSQSFMLSFVHVWLPNSSLGGYWLFKGMTGYVI